jgi:acetyl esterase/lipase
MAMAFLVSLAAFATPPAQERRPPAQGQPLDPAKADVAPARPGAPPKNARRAPADPLARNAPQPNQKAQQAAPKWPYHYKMQLPAPEPPPLAARYYPSQLGIAAPVVLLLHESGPGRAGKDFEDPIADLKDMGLAPYLQEKGYAVVVLDLRNPAAGSANAWRNQVADVQAAYRFLLGRHNRRELNLAKFGVLGLGEGANLASLWASLPAAAVSIEGRPTDLGALLLVSPLPEVANTRLAPSVTSLAPRIPMLLLAGTGDQQSADIVNSAKTTVERQRFSKVQLLDARQHGYNLLRFAPKATEPILTFLDNTLKIRTDEWEPRYNLAPIQPTNVSVVNTGPEAAKAERQPDQKKAEPQPDQKKTNATNPAAAPKSKNQP